jgi:hypothetical protein
MAEPKEKAMKVFSPDLNSPKDEKDAFIKILDRTIAEGEAVEQNAPDSA